MFPVGVSPPPRGERLDTINRLILHGARFHDRSTLFEARSHRAPIGGLRDVPDWQADRLSIRVALVLHEELSVRSGDAVALWIPLSPAWAVFERGIWGLGAASLAIPAELPPSDVSRALEGARAKVLVVPTVVQATAVSLPGSVTAVVTLEEPVEDPRAARFGISLREVLDRGGVLDTPERASGFRETARAIDSSVPASIELDLDRGESWVAATQGDWARDAEILATERPPRRGDRSVVTGPGIDRAARLSVYAAWADGLTSVVFDESEEWNAGPALC